MLQYQKPHPKISTVTHTSVRRIARAWWYATIILTPLAAVLLASWWYGPSLNRIMGW
jgi:hypothetical protein